MLVAFNTKQKQLFVSAAILVPIMQKLPSQRQVFNSKQSASKCFMQYTVVLCDWRDLTSILPPARRHRAGCDLTSLSWQKLANWKSNRNFQSLYIYPHHNYHTLPHNYFFSYPSLAVAAQSYWFVQWSCPATCWNNGYKTSMLCGICFIKLLTPETSSSDFHYKQTGHVSCWKLYTRHASVT